MGVAEHTLGLSMGMSGDFETGACLGGGGLVGREDRRMGGRAGWTDKGRGKESCVAATKPLMHAGMRAHTRKHNKQRSRVAARACGWEQVSSGSGQPHVQTAQ